MKIINKIRAIIAVFVGNRFSLHKMFTNKKATAEIIFVADDRLGGSIVVDVDGIEYHFEGKAIIDEYKNLSGENCIKKKLNYGGWSMNMTDKRNKIL